MTDQNHITRRTNQELRDLMSKKIKREEVIRCSNVQIIILIIAKKYLFFLSELANITGLDKRTLIYSLLLLTNRNLLNRVKEVNPHIMSGRKLHYQYKITAKGNDLIEEVVSSKKIRFFYLLRDIRAKKNKGVADNDIRSQRAKLMNKTHVGKNQVIIMRILKQRGSKFLSEIRKDTLLNSDTLTLSLKRLKVRGLVMREKRYNPETHQQNFQYSISDSGRELLKQAPQDIVFSNLLADKKVSKLIKEKVTRIFNSGDIHEIVLILKMLADIFSYWSIILLFSGMNLGHPFLIP